MTVLVGRRESFSAAHQLCDPDLSDDENRRLFGKCTHLHGHLLQAQAGLADPKQRLNLRRLARVGLREQGHALAVDGVHAAHRIVERLLQHRPHHRRLQSQSSPEQ